MVPQCPAQDRAHGRCSGKACLRRELLKRFCLEGPAWAARSQVPWALWPLPMVVVVMLGGGGGDLWGGSLAILTSFPVTEEPHSQVGWYSQRWATGQPRPLFPGFCGPAQGAGAQAPPAPAPAWCRLVLAVGPAALHLQRPGQPRAAGLAAGENTDTPEAEGAPAGGMRKAWGQSVCVWQGAGTSPCSSHLLPAPGCEV